MCHKTTAQGLTLVLIGAIAAAAQTNGRRVDLDWRPIGTTAVAAGLPGAAGGPVERVWFSTDGSVLFTRTPSGVTWQTSDMTRWTAAPEAEPPPTSQPASIEGLDVRARAKAHPLQASRIFAAGQHVWRSDNSGGQWTNVTDYGGSSILGGALNDLTLSPANSDEIVVGGATGVWRSLDGGASWSGLNDNLPSLPVRRLLSVADGESVARIAIGDSLQELVWQSGNGQGWRIASDSRLAANRALQSAASAALNTQVTAVAQSGEYIYAGSSEGLLFVSNDRGTTWRAAPATGLSSRIERIFVDPRDALFAVVITASRGRNRVLRTSNGGFWDDITSGLPAEAVVRGVTADRSASAVYVATNRGVYFTAQADVWQLVRAGDAYDVMLDGGGNQLYVAFDGSGVYAALAPHRLRDPRVVSAGDRAIRAAAPGSLLSVLGARIQSARAGEQNAAVLAATDLESQVQLPFDLNGSGVLLSMASPSGRVQLGLPLRPASPSIFVDRDGNPLVMNADTGLMLDMSAPARSGMRLQILATGLGKVNPVWPTGLPAPLENPPGVVATVRAVLERESLEVTRATLAPGYVGLYLVEVQLPGIVNRGTAELFLQVGGETSNAVRIYLEP